MNYENAVKTLCSQGKFYIDLGLERTKQVLEFLGNPQDKINAIQVAGTNGKGSVCSMLENVLREAGYRTGLYTSPHIFEYTERIKINGEDITQDEFGKYFELVNTTAEYNKIHLTEFEILTIMMFKYFADNNVEIAIVETGLGGRLDATNVLEQNLCAVITHIDYDHTDRLGNTKDAIATEKAGIIKPDSTIITSEGYEVVKDRADELGALFVLANPCVEPVFAEALALKGHNQIENLALVLAVMEVKFNHVPCETILRGLEKVKHPCRFEYFADKNMIIDGAHNPDCMRALVRNLDYYYPDMKHQFIFGCLETKDYKNMLDEIFYDRNMENVYLFEFKNGNSLKYDAVSSEYDIKKLSEGFSIENNNEVVFSKDTLTVVCGSFYMLKELFKV